jgi:hypothetical protein
MRNFSSILIFKEKIFSLNLYYTHYPRYNIKNKSKNNHFGEYYQKKKNLSPSWIQPPFRIFEHDSIAFILVQLSISK